MSDPWKSPSRQRWASVGLVLLLLLGLLYAFAAVSDLVATKGGLPRDHEGTFAALTGTTFGDLHASTPGVAGYVTLLERGYAVHELTFAVLFLVIVAIPFRRRQRWAWWAAWTPTIANLGYTFTFGAHDSTILARSLAADVALPLLLLAHLPAFIQSSRHPNRQPPS